VKPIEPVFLDFSKDLEKFNAKKDIPVIYKRNTENERFELSYIFEMGTNSDKALGLAFSYLRFLGTSKYTPEQIQSEFYKLACSFSVSSSPERVTVSLSGLSQNMERALVLLEELLSDPQVNEVAFANLIRDTENNRRNAKLELQNVFNMLRNYAVWGRRSPQTNVLSSAELRALRPQNLITRITDLHKYQRRITYYGPHEKTEFLRIINDHHRVSEILQPPIPPQRFEEQMTRENGVLFVHYPGTQINFAMISKRGERFDEKKIPIVAMYNSYFGGGMGSIVFQEMREVRGLAYSASANFVTPPRLDQTYRFQTFIATQNDKMDDAVQAFHDIINNMPESENVFDVARENLLTNLRTQRITRGQVISSYIAAQDLGLNYDRNRVIFENAQNLTLTDVINFQQEHIRNRRYTYCIAGDKDDLDFRAMATYGRIQRLTLTDIFGY